MFNSIPNKKRLIAASLVLLILSIVAIIILANINRSLRKKNTDSNQTNEEVSHIIAIFEKPFFIELTTNLSTGYQWQADFDTEIIKLNNVNFRQQSTGEQLGVDEIQIFEFQSLQKTDTIINFRYVKPWETDSAPIKTKVFNISIK